MSQDPRIRLAIAADAETIALESMAEIEHNLNWTWNPMRVARAIADDDTNVAVAVQGSAIVGFGIMRYEDELAHLQLFAVREDSRRQGIGSALLAWLERVAIVSGVTRLEVEARRDNLAAIAFYRRHGYAEREAVRAMYHATEDGLRFEKVLSATAVSLGKF